MDECLIGMLDWHEPEDVQARGRWLLRERFPWAAFSGPWSICPDKGTWINIAKVICGLDDKTLAPHLKQLLPWLQDLNWPGAILLVNRLCQFEGKGQLDQALQAALDTAEQDDDEDWTENLRALLERRESFGKRQPPCGKGGRHARTSGKANVHTMLIMLMLLFITAIPTTCVMANRIEDRDLPFTPERWEASSLERRHQYVKSLQEDRELVGMSRDQIYALLGPGSTAMGVPDNGHAYEEYRIEDDPLGGWKVLLFEYDGDTVVSVRETWEDW